MKLRKAITFLMMPFYIGNGRFGQTSEALPHGATRWEPCRMKIENGAFYPHIQQFLQSSVTNSGDWPQTPRSSDLHIYSLLASDDVRKHLIRWPMVMRLGSGEAATTLRIAFMQSDLSLFSPKLVVLPTASVGLLILPLQPLDDITDKQLVRMNYLLHKISRRPCPLRLCPTDPNYRLPQANNRGRGSEEKLADALNLPHPARGEQVTFTLPQVVEALMRGIDYRVFNPDMFHAFTYVQISTADWNSAEHTKTEKGHHLNERMYNFARIVLCINDKYRLSHMQVEKLVSRSFQNVYMGSSASGGGIMTIADDDSPDFMRNFHTDSLQPRYLWVYILALIQQHTLLNMTRWLSSMPSDPRSDQATLKQMRHSLKHMSELNVSMRFSCISDYSQHNTFYRHCSNNLGTLTLCGEVDRKIATLTDMLEQLSDQMKETLQVWFTVILALLTLFSATNDGLDVIQKMMDHTWAWVVGVLFIFAMLCLFGWLAQRFRRFFSSK